MVESRREGKDEANTCELYMRRDTVKLASVEEQQKHVSLCPGSLLICPTTKRQVKAISFIHHS